MIINSFKRVAHLKVQEKLLYCPHCSQLSIVQSIVTPNSGLTILFTIVDNCEQCGQHNIVQSCYTADSQFLGMYSRCDVPIILTCKLRVELN